jgi:hypothetical protein
VTGVIIKHDSINKCLLWLKNHGYKMSLSRLLLLLSKDNDNKKLFKGKFLFSYCSMILMN